MATQLHTMTADELLAMPDDGIRRELVAGSFGRLRQRVGSTDESPGTSRESCARTSGRTGWA